MIVRLQKYLGSLNPFICATFFIFIMKGMCCMRKIISICLMICLVFTLGVVFVGCGENYTAEQISTYYTEIKEKKSFIKGVFK